MGHHADFPAAMKSHSHSLACHTARSLSLRFLVFSFPGSRRGMGMRRRTSTWTVAERDTLLVSGRACIPDTFWHQTLNPKHRWETEARYSHLWQPWELEYEGSMEKGVRCR